MYLCAFIVISLFSFNALTSDKVIVDVNYDIKYALVTPTVPMPSTRIYDTFSIVCKCINYSRINLWINKIPIQQSNTYG